MVCGGQSEWGGVPRYRVQVMDPSFPFVQAWSLSQVTEALVS